MTILELGLGSGGRHGGGFGGSCLELHYCAPVYLGVPWARFALGQGEGITHRNMYQGVQSSHSSIDTVHLFLVGKENSQHNWLLRSPTSPESRCSQEDRQMSRAVV